jgi:hypothetical protein
MNFKSLALATVAAVGITGAANAATFGIDGGTNFDLPGIFDPGISGIADGTTIKVFDSASDGISTGLKVIGSSAPIKYRLVSYEAGFFNIGDDAGGLSFDKNDPLGSSFTQLFPGLLPPDGRLVFRFSSVTTGLQATNSGVIDEGNRLGILQVSANRVFLFYDDGGAGNDSDFDDMVIEATIVPLPASALLLLGGIAGFAAVRRRKTA